jgi:hypothetical protein
MSAAAAAAAPPTPEQELQKAIADGDEARTAALLDERPSLLDAPLKDPAGRRSPLALAVALPRMGIVRELLRRGADANKDFGELSAPLALAVVGLDSPDDLAVLLGAVWTSTSSASLEVANA